MILQGLALFSIGCLVKKYLDGGYLASDWLAYWSAGKVIIAGIPEKLYDIRFFLEMQAPYIQGVCPFLYAPAFALPFVPLALLPFEFARFVWFAAHLLCLGACVQISDRWTGLSRLWAGTGMVAYTPLALALYIGQVTPVLLLAIVLIVRDELNGRLKLRTGLIAGVLLVKPQLLAICVLFWLFRRRWYPLLGLAISSSLVVFLSFLVHPDALFDFLEARHELGAIVFQNVLDRGINPTIYSSGGVIAAVVVSLFVLGLLVYLWNGTPSQNYLALLWTAPLLVTPYLGIHDIGLLVLPASLVLKAADASIKTVLWICWLVPLFILVSGASFHFAIWTVLGFFLGVSHSLWKASNCPLPIKIEN